MIAAPDPPCRHPEWSVQKAGARSKLRLAIEDALDSGLPRVYTPGLYRDKCAALLEYVYESYPERDAGVYAAIPSRHDANTACS